MSGTPFPPPTTTVVQPAATADVAPTRSPRVRCISVRRCPDSRRREGMDPARASCAGCRLPSRSRRTPTGRRSARIAAPSAEGGGHEGQRHRAAARAASSDRAPGVHETPRHRPRSTDDRARRRPLPSSSRATGDCAASQPRGRGRSPAGLTRAGSSAPLCRRTNSSTTSSQVLSVSRSVPSMSLSTAHPAGVASAECGVRSGMGRPPVCDLERSLSPSDPTIRAVRRPSANLR